jgi:hypothetical protein
MRKSWLSFGSGDSYKKSRNVEIAPTTSFSNKPHIVTRTDGRGRRRFFRIIKAGEDSQLIYNKQVDADSTLKSKVVK